MSDDRFFRQLLVMLHVIVNYDVIRIVVTEDETKFYSSQGKELFALRRSDVGGARYVWFLEFLSELLSALLRHDTRKVTGVGIEMWEEKTKLILTVSSL